MTFGRQLWEPDGKTVRDANITKYSQWLSSRGEALDDYPSLWRWSVEDIEGFWGSIWDYFGVIGEEPYGRVLGKRSMPGAEWFPGTKLNYAEHVLRHPREGVALVTASEGGPTGQVSWEDLRRQTMALSVNLREAGLKMGDAVAAYLPNSVESVVGLLASASMGAVWTSCSPEFGAQAVVDRFGQVKPAALITVQSYRYGGKEFDRTAEVDSIVSALPGLKKVIVVGREGRGGGSRRREQWSEAVSGRGKLSFERVPFDHPLWVLYSSGTTGLPKPIVQGQGGILLEHLKELSLHNDVKMGDRFFWYTTTGWMMWNYMMGSLLHGSSAVLYDGSPGYPDMGALWDLVERNRVTFMGVSAAYIGSCQKSGVNPRSTHRLDSLVGIGSTGSPLSSEGFEWVYDSVKNDLWLASICGGTDVCTAFVGGNPTLPVFSGEIQCRCLGAKVEAYDEAGRPVVGEVGELVVEEPMPSMPLYLLGDPQGSRMRESYFDVYPGVWRHGDWIMVTPRGTCVVYGRSDATIKRMGVRIGTSEVYRAVEPLPEVADCLAIDIENRTGGTEMILFVATAGGAVLDGVLVEKIRSSIRGSVSPRHVPDRIIQVPSVPRTLNGKRLEVPLKRIFMGQDPSKVVNRESLQDPRSIDYYVALAEDWRGGKL